MNIQKIKVAAFAITERLKGNHLLKNPKGVPVTTVSVLMHSEGLNPFTLDKSSTFVTITKDFSQGKSKTLKKFLFVDEYANYNKATQKVEYQKHIDYSAFDSEGLIVAGEKGRPDFEILEKRDLSYTKKIVSQKTETLPDFTFAYLGIAMPKRVTIKRTLADVQINKFYKTKKTIPRQNFFKTLWENLKQS